MTGLHYTAVHIRSLLGLSRTELQRWLSVLPPFNQVETKARTARVFTITDLAFFRIVVSLHERLGMPLASIAAFSSMLHDQLDMRPALAGSTTRYYLNQTDEGTWETNTEARGPLSIAIDMEPIWWAVYQFVGIDVPAQRELALGLVSLPSPTAQENLRGRVAR
ncbi:hypothetical protein [Burkholderia glumae]|uniref:hypothetical protein n=1 Tax=Burkholderia glumae TaxID=337 RepID=UPI0021508D18|nr:hypothetical protein [Burkholderia glumae]